MGSLVYQQKIARTLAFKIYYQRLYLGTMPLSEEWLTAKMNLSISVVDYLTQLLAEAKKNKPEVEGLIKQNLIGWTKSRIDPLFSSVLEVALAEIMFVKTANFKIVINEAVEFIKNHVSLEAAKMGNALLDKIHQLDQKLT